MASRVTIVEESLSGRLLLASLFSAGHYDVVCIGSANELTATIEASAGLVVLGPGVERLPEVLTKIVGMEAFRATPCLVLGRDVSPQARLNLVSRGARDVLDYPVSEALLLARARSVLREAETFRELERRRQATLKFGFSEEASVLATQKRIAWVQDPNRTTDLSGFGVGTSWSVVSMKVSEALAPDADKACPEGYVLDWRGSSETSPVRLALPELRARAHSRHAGILVIVAHDSPEAAVHALDSGASDVVPATALDTEVVLRISRMLKQKIAEEALRKSADDSLLLAVTDPLTGLYNRRYAEAYLSDLIADRHPGRSFAVMIADIDRFKSINDRYGHSVGDLVLQTVAKRLRAEMRALDLVARYGGEEFLIVLAESNLKQARRAANRLRQRVGTSPVQLPDGQRVDVTLSIGVSLGDARLLRSSGDQQTGRGHRVMADLLARADAALYDAKGNGRNRVHMAAISGGNL